jgi:HEAT repeat protein
MSSPQEKKKPKVNFATVLEGLTNPDVPFPPYYLHLFSELDPKSLQDLKAAWPNVKPDRQFNLLEDLEEMSDADSLTNFEEVGRLFMNDPNPRVRAQALRLTFTNEDVRIIPDLIRYLEHDPDPLVRATAADGLGIYVLMGETDLLPEARLKLIVEHLLKAVQQSPDEVVRLRALESLGYSSYEEVPALIQAAYDRGVPQWVESALYAMGRSADPAWEKAVLKQFSNKRDSIRYHAIQAAGDLELAAARPVLLDMLEEEKEDDLRAAAIWSLSQIGGPEVKQRLESLLEASDDEDEAEFIEEALENLNFTDDNSLFDLFNTQPDSGSDNIAGDDEDSPED